jgi:hypothetical protein
MLKIYRRYPYRYMRNCNPDAVDDNKEYKLERILDSRVHRGKMQYRVKWLDYEHDPV